MRFQIASALPNARLASPDSRGSIRSRPGGLAPSPRGSGARAVGLAVLLASASAWGCAGSWAYRQGQGEAKKGNWDVAVARLTKALQKDPKNIGYKIAVENARMQASRFHYDEGRKALAADNLEKAADELEVASKYDPGNKSASDDLALVRTRIRKRDEERQRLADFEALKKAPPATRIPVPVLSPRSPVPISLKFQDTGLEKIFQTLSKLSGVNIVFDEGYRDKRIPLVDLSGVTFQEALDQITFANRLFYKVLDSNTLIIVSESVQNRRKYDEQFLQTFYLQNADVNETLNLVKALAGVQQKAVANPSLGAISVVGTPDQLALVQRIIDTNDKSRGEVMVEVSILEVNRSNLKNYGIELSNYTASSTFSPTGGASPLGGGTTSTGTTGTPTTTASGEVSGGLTSVRAHLLSSLNLSDFVVSIPSTLLTRFLQTDSTARLLASPRLRAAEGKKTQLMIGTEVPVPITQFTSANPTPGQGGSTFAPATSFNYRNVGVNLELTPKVSAGGEITLELAAEFSLLGQTTNLGGQDLPTFLTRKVNGILRLRDGETNLIGGLVQGRDSVALTGAFGLQSIPVLNKLLTSTKKERDDFEILISITPHLVRAPKITSEDLASLFTGTTEITKVKGARPPLFGTEEPVAAPTPAPSPAASPAAPQPTPSPVPTPAPTPAPPDPRQMMPTEAPPVPVPGPLGPQGPVPEGPPMPPGLQGPVGPPGFVPSETAPSESTGPAGPNASVLLSPSERMLRIGETGTVDVVLLGARGIRVIEVVVGYDPALIEAVEAVAGSLLTMDGSPVGTERGFELGRARIRFTRTTGVSGSGAVTTLKIRALKPGAGWLRLESIVLVDGGTIEQPAIPAPTRIQVLPERFGGVR